MMVLTAVAVPATKAEAQTPSGYDFDVNIPWTLSQDVTSKHTGTDTIKSGSRAYLMGRSQIGDIGVTATFTPTSGRELGVSYLSANGNNQAAYGMTSDMLYGNPDPASLPALGINTQPGSMIGSYDDYGNYQENVVATDKLNLKGRSIGNVPPEEGILTLKFDQPVTDPVLDLSGLGGNSHAGTVYSYYENGSWTGPYLAARASFNSTDLELITPDITMDKVASNSNLKIENNTIQVVDRNTYFKAVLAYRYDIFRYMNKNDQYFDVRSPDLAPAGSGSVILKGTFDKVEFKLYHVATPSSAFPTEQYGTDSIYSWNSSWGGQYGDGINGLNVLNSEKFTLGGTWYEAGGTQNMDLFRASIRLPKPSSLAGNVWEDANYDGLQSGNEFYMAGVTATLLDENGNRAKDFNGNEVADITVNADGSYKFDNLAAGSYQVTFTQPEGYMFTKPNEGNDITIDSDVNAEGKTDLIELGINEHKMNIDAGLVKPASVSGKVWVDTDKDGTQNDAFTDEDKQAIATAKAKLVDSEGNAVKDFDGNDVAEVTVNEDGTYAFTNLKPGDYRVIFTAPDGHEFTKQYAGDSTVDSNANRVTGETEVITLQSGDEKTNYDAGITPIKYQVTHQFVSGTEGRVLPDAVKALLPENQKDKLNGAEVTPNHLPKHQ